MGFFILTHGVGMGGGSAVVVTAGFLSIKSSRIDVPKATGIIKHAFATGVIKIPDNDSNED